MKHARPKTQHRDLEQRLAIRRKRLVLEDSYACRRDYFDRIASWHWKYVELLRVAELRHRYGLGDPNEPVVEATEDAERLASLWKEGSRLRDRRSPNPKPYTESGWMWEHLPLRVDVIEFRFGVAAVLSLLVYQNMSPTILEVVPRMSDWTDAEGGFNYINFPDAGLVAVLQTGKRPQKWHALLDYATRNFGSSLLQDSFECYAEIIVAAKRRKWDEALRAVGLAHELYAQRENSTFECNEFEPWEGVWAGNALSIDLRLAALMRHCFRQNSGVLDKLTSIHRWKS